MPALRRATAGPVILADRAATSPRAAQLRGNARTDGRAGFRRVCDPPGRGVIAALWPHCYLHGWCIPGGPIT